MNAKERKAALLEELDRLEDAQMLLSCLPRSPALWEDVDADEDDDAIRDRLEADLFLRNDDGVNTTTATGRDWLIRYIKGEL